MIVLDTNVLSEPLRSAPDPGVLAWLAEITEPVAITAVSVGELLVGVGRLPEGRWKDELRQAIETTVADFSASILPYDEDAARRYAELHRIRKAAGRPLSTEDGMIAAITAANGATLATRNTRDFELLGVDLLDPWAG